MSTPQQPELRRSGLGSTDGQGTQLRAGDELPEEEAPTGAVPEESQPNHHPEHEQDRPQVPPHLRG